MRLPRPTPAVLAFAALACLPQTSASAETPQPDFAPGALASPWSPGANSRARLLAAGGLEPGASPPVYLAGVEIELKPGAHTYWRQPGDAGAPPTASFEGSANLKSADLRFPAPERIDEAGLHVLGYRRDVILPMEVHPIDPDKPVHVAVAFSYAACARMCVPAEVRAALDLAPQEARGPDAGRLTLAAAEAPERVSPGDPVSLRIEPIAGRDKPTWRVSVDQPGGPWRDLFVEGPEGWYFETTRVGDGFEVVADEQPSDAKGPPATVFTLAGPRDFEMKVALPKP